MSFLFEVLQKIFFLFFREHEKFLYLLQFVILGFFTRCLLCLISIGVNISCDQGRRKIVSLLETERRILYQRLAKSERHEDYSE